MQARQQSNGRRPVIPVHGPPHVFMVIAYSGVEELPTQPLQKTISALQRIAQQAQHAQLSDTQPAAAHHVAPSDQDVTLWPFTEMTSKNRCYAFDTSGRIYNLTGTLVCDCTGHKADQLSCCCYHGITEPT